MAKFRKLTFRPFQVRYAWLENGAVKTGKTVVESLDVIGAWRKFHKQNPHVMVITGSDNIKDPSFRVLLSIYIRQSHLTPAAA
jgi:hypothetical protein